MAWLDEGLVRADRGEGRMIAVRGRRQVGNSRLITEWLARTGRPGLYYQARGTPTPVELEALP